MKKTMAAILIAVMLAALLGGCGSSASSGSGFGEIEATLPELDSATIDSSDSGFGDIEATLPEIGSVTIEAPDYGFSDIEVNLPEIESMTIEAPTYNFGDITVIPPSGDLTLELHMPDYQFSEITVEGVTLSIPEVDYEISYDKIGSAYTDTYTKPNIQVGAPGFKDPELEEVFVSVADNLTLDGQYQLSEMTDAQFAQIASVQLNLADRLFDAIKASGVTLAIDPMSGSIPIDATLLFDTDKYELKPEGKAALKTVFTIYCSVLAQDEFRDAVDAVIIEGHTDTQGDHEYNQQLSEKRAGAVRDFLLSEECGLPDTAFLEGLLTTVGRSYDDPVYAADGSVDMAASRRVEIHFAPNLDVG